MGWGWGVGGIDHLFQASASLTEFFVKTLRLTLQLTSHTQNKYFISASNQNKGS